MLRDEAFPAEPHRAAKLRSYICKHPGRAPSRSKLRCYV